MIHSQVKTKSGYEDLIAYDINEIEFSRIYFSSQRKNKQIYLFCDEFACLDTETSHDGVERGWIYQWAVKFNGDYIYGRTPSEFISLLEKMRDYYELNDMKKIIFYIHNASYDVQYLKYFLKRYDDNLDIFATDNHTILIVDVFGFRFLCSYKLSNMNLDKFSNTYSEKYIKAVGEIDYTKIRYQDDELSPADWLYMFSDAAAQHDAITNYLKVNGYNKAHKGPFTSTGFVRKDCRRAAEKSKNWRTKFKRMSLTLEQYNLCRQAFMGGLTIANFKYAGCLITDKDEPIKHVDYNSSYPARQMMNYFPVGKPAWYGTIDDRDELNLLLNTFCCVFLLTMNNVHIKDGITAPCIPSSKCLHLENELKINGKIVYADTLTIAVTEIDFKWIKRQYTADDLKIQNMLTFTRGKIPDWLKNRIMYYYDNKCKLKHDDPKLYQCSKGLLNGIYGMSATAICRDSYKLNDDMMLENEPEDAQKQIDKFYRSFNSFMPYQFGVYTTAWARDALLTMIECVGYDKFLYCDTDSVFYLSTPANEKRLRKMNADIKKKAIAAGAYIGNNILGVATHEPDIKRFKALHAKCYAMEEYTNDGIKLNVVVAGIPKKTTKFIKGKPITKTNAEELKDIDNLKDGFIFKHNGGTRAVYVEQDITTGDINGHETEYASSCIILNIEKEISDTMWTRAGDFTPLHIKQEIL